MQPWTTHTGRAVALIRDDVDTDQIVPSEFCKRISRTGYTDALFNRWRAAGDFVLDRPEHAGATVLLAGNNFGIGSSREHAVWALKDFGFSAIVASGFGDIFFKNALNNGLLPIDLGSATVRALMDWTTADPKREMSIDLNTCELRFAGRTIGFTIESRARRMLLNGYDQIAMTILSTDMIDAYETRRPEWLPVVRPQPARRVR